MVLKTREVKVVEPLEVIRQIAEERNFSQKFTDEAVSGYLGLSPLQRIEMERFAGTLLQAPLQ
ncbi:MAG: hypothetical protein ACREX3_19225 [Gammaproteobacteria bacterium]